MSLSRRDFIKVVGISIASMALTRCNSIEAVSARDRLRRCWMSFGELVQVSIEESNRANAENTFGQGLVAEHRTALDELVTSGEITVPVADLVHETYDAAVYHVWSTNIQSVCYDYMPALTNYYTSSSAEALVRQAEALEEVAAQGTIDPATLDKARAALEHDMAFYSLSEEEVSALHDRIINDWQTLGQTLPSFEEIDLDITAEAKAAALFIINLLTGK
ncbi:MAG: hypothetical protein AB1531_05895 [Chloroflexota bacterium]